MTAEHPFGHPPIPRDLHCTPTGTQWCGSSKWRSKESKQSAWKTRLSISSCTISQNTSLTVWGVMSHLNRFEILILFYIFHDWICEVWDWNLIFYEIARGIQIVEDVLFTIIWNMSNSRAPSPSPRAKSPVTFLINCTYLVKSKSCRFIPF